MTPRRLIPVVMMTLLVAACGGMMMGTPDPVDRDAIVMHLDATASAEAVAETLTQQGVEYAILSAPRDSAWFADVATRASLATTRPGAVSGRTFAFIGPKALGDTTLTLSVPGGGVLRIHDALFEIDKNHRLDLLAVQMDSTVSAQRSLTRLLEYIAKDVGATVSVLLAIEAPTAVSDSLEVLLRPLYTDMYECTTEGRTGAAPADLPIRAYFGPIARMRCNGAERLDRGTMLGHFEIGL